ncbi:MAG: S8 family serine peptidase [Anaerolineae bacterium]|nr:S8 family serine peptidase [Anaerolineae bacterium]
MNTPFSQPRDEDVNARHVVIALVLMAAVGLACVLMLVVNGALLLVPIANQLGLPPIQQSFIQASFVAIAVTIAVGVVLWFFTHRPRLRAIGLTLLWGSLLAIPLTLIRLSFSLDDVFKPALLRIIFGILFSVPILWRNGRPDFAAFIAKFPIAIIVGTAMLAPFAINGALGSGLDTLRALIEAKVLGLIAASLVVLLRPAVEEDASGVTSHGLAGVVVTLIMLLVAGAWGQDDLNFLLILTLPWLGRLIVTLSKAKPNFVAPQPSNWPASALLVTLATFGVLAFVSPTEFNAMTIIDRYTGRFALTAALQALGIAIVISTLLAWAATRWHIATAGWMWGIAGLILVLTGVGYWRLGQPGFYPNDFIVILKNQADLSKLPTSGDPAIRRQATYQLLVNHAEQTQGPIREDLNSRGTKYRPYYIVNAIEISSDAWVAWRLSQRADVDRVLYSPELRRYYGPYAAEDSAEINKPNLPTWGLRYINADKVWNELKVRGKGIVVAGSDSGVDWRHPALREQYRGKDGNHNYNWLDPWRNQPEPYDESGHGTHTIGSVLGINNIGVAPDALWYACANLLHNYGSPAYYLDCMQFTLAPHPQGGDPFKAGRPDLGADISTNSWGCPPVEGCDLRVLEPGVQALNAAGIFAVFAAGNEGPGCNSLGSPPALYAPGFVVGAIDAKGNLTDFSSRGPNAGLPNERIGPDVLAPGAGVLSAWPNGQYHVTSGTSMATPHVAGVVALMWSANPALRGDVTRTAQILRETVKPYAGEAADCSLDSKPDPATGYGVVDALAAVKAALAIK